MSPQKSVVMLGTKYWNGTTFGAKSSALVFDSAAKAKNAMKQVSAEAKKGHSVIDAPADIIKAATNAAKKLAKAA